MAQTNFDGVSVPSGDSLLANGVPIREVVSFNLQAAHATAAGWLFRADRAYRVVGVHEKHAVVGGASSTLALRKITTDGTAPNAAIGANVKELLTTPISLTSTVNTLQNATLVATAADLLLAAGDWIAYNPAGTAGSYAGTVQFELAAI